MKAHQLFFINSFDVQLTSINTSNCNVSNGSGFNNISDNKLFDCLILRDTTCAIGAADSFHMSSVVLATSSITAFLGLEIETKQKFMRLELRLRNNLIFTLILTGECIINSWLDAVEVKWITSNSLRLKIRNVILLQPIFIKKFTVNEQLITSFLELL